jgi:nitric-oxide synthase
VDAYRVSGGGLVFAEAERFLRLLYAERPELGEPGPRVDEVRVQIEATGTYVHTAQELAHGARLAWRNNTRCIGRLYWRSLMVRDRRHVSEARQVFDECVEHLRLANNGGKIRPIITVFAPDTPQLVGPRIHNDQLVRYAGWSVPDVGRVGDPLTVGLTGQAEKLGWRGAGTRFDLLPLIVESADGTVLCEKLPTDAALEVPITHPTLWWFTGLGLRWYAVPAISNMDLVIGGVTYGCAPFNGWYMGTEIGARNLADVDRYDMLPRIAEKMKLDTRSERTLWKDRALLELNVAVLHSFERAGVTIVDHHTEAKRFLAHLDKEQRDGRPTPGDWSWLVPPMSPATTGVFHRYYDPRERSPAFVPRGSGCPAFHD